MDLYGYKEVNPWPVGKSIPVASIGKTLSFSFLFFFLIVAEKCCTSPSSLLIVTGVKERTGALKLCNMTPLAFGFRE